MVHILGALESISGPHCRVNKWSPSFCSVKIKVSEDCSEPGFSQGSEFSLLSGVLVLNQGFQKRGGKELFLHFLFWWLLFVDDTTRL